MVVDQKGATLGKRISVSETRDIRESQKTIFKTFLEHALNSDNTLLVSGKILVVTLLANHQWPSRF